ncbi:uncharacterized protein BX664DRAFT_360724 [Halteromyces radiatus]|uniref:uncharacterized protein n=1 Tax=Halteromyces radiatus TaxID=101107 RepID=UPI00221E9D35|nr:uncharacterized protein BX664DRAFT_360724 [Halteromyces radiatus]KAI8084914.1 hypothetical protein BX664DRAFT_360724 [Halteromyces radiatus]
MFQFDHILSSALKVTHVLDFLFFPFSLLFPILFFFIVFFIMDEKQQRPIADNNAFIRTDIEQESSLDQQTHRTSSLPERAKQLAEEMKTKRKQYRQKNVQIAPFLLFY